MSEHIANQVRNPALAGDNVLHVIGAVTNPARYHSRYRLAREWLARMQDTRNVVVYLVEAAFGDRQFEVTDSTNPRHLQLRTNSEIWTKENLINLGVRHLLPKGWRYVAWIDADVEFRDPSWAQEALHQLQHFPAVQPWTQCADLGHLGGINQTFNSFGLLNQRGVNIQVSPTDPYPYGHSGFAWAATRAFWEQTGGLVDFAILGSADHHMAWAMAGDVDKSIHKRMSPGFFRRLHEWQIRAMRETGGQIGFSPGRIEHSFHGPKKNRYYRERWQILIDHGFDPDTDLSYDSQGMIQLAEKPALEQSIRLYNRARQEDSISEEV